MSADVKQEIEELRQRVELLESKLVEDTKVGGRDRYDEFVLSKLKNAGESVPNGTVLRWYRQAGVKNKGKIRTRLRDLAAEGLMESVGKTHWRYSGPEQTTLEVEP